MTGIRPPLSSNQHPIPPLLFLSSYAAFFVLGLSGAMVGPAKDAVVEALGVSVERAGVLVSAQFAGATAGAWVAGHMADRVEIRRVLCTAGALIVTGLVLFGLARSFALVVLAQALLGLGLGGWAAGPNIMFATAGLKRPGVWLNLLNGIWGIGSACGPPLVDLALDYQRLNLAYFAAAVLATALVIVFWGSRWRLPERGRSSAGKGPGWRVYLPFALIFVAYVGAESGFGAWVFTQVTRAAGGGSTHATLAASLFWGGLTLSRMLAVVVLKHVRDRHLLIGCALTIAAGALLMVLLPAFENLAVAAAFLVGMGCGPIFPTTYAWVIRAVPGTRAAALATLQAVGTFGAVIVPPLQGYVGRGKDGGMLVIVLLGLVLAGLFAYLAKRRAG